MESCLTSTDGTKYRAGYYESWLIWRNNKIKSSNLKSEESSLVYTGHNND